MPKKKMRKQDEINERIEEVYRFVCGFISEHDVSPSLQEIAEGCYMSRGNVSRYLDKLEVQRRIKRMPGTARSIALLKD